MPKSDDPIAQPARPHPVSSGCGFGIAVLGLLVIFCFCGLIRLRRSARLWQFARCGPTAKSAMSRRALAETDRVELAGHRFAAPGYGTLVPERQPQDRAPKRLDEVLANRTAGVPQLRMITIADAKGLQRQPFARLLAAESRRVGPRLTSSLRRDGTAAGLFISEPLITRSEKPSGDSPVAPARRRPWRVRRSRYPAIVDLADLERFYGSVTLGEGERQSSSCATMARCWCATRRRLRRSPERSQISPPYNRLRRQTRLVSPIDGRRDFIAVATRSGHSAGAGGHPAMRPLPCTRGRDEATRLAVRTIVVTVLGLAAIAALWAPTTGASRRVSAHCGTVRSATHWRWEGSERRALGLEPRERSAIPVVEDENARG